MPGNQHWVTSASAAADVLAAPPTAQHDAAPPPEPEGSPPAGSPPRLADDLELIGEFADSGFKQAPFIARRGDGQVVQMPELLYRLAEQVDGRAGYADIAERFSRAVRRQVGEADARMLIEQRLRPLGVVAPADGAEQHRLRRVDPLLALKLRAAVVPDEAVRSLTTVFRPLFWGPVMVAVTLALVAVDVWLFGVHGISQSVRHTLDQPALMLVVIGGVILATAFHEIGHATACRYGGARPGAMGMGIYLVWPAFYTDITDAYRLGRWGRLRTDVGGMYFNAIFALAVTAAYLATSFEPLLLLVALQTMAIAQQALPVLRLDGYYILSDLTGVPDIFLRIRPILLSLVPGREAGPRVSELKGWVRAVVTVYVVAVVAFLTVTALALVINLPRIVATGYSSADAHFSSIGPALGDGAVASAVLGAVQGLFLILPGLGLIYTAGRVVHRALSAALRWSAGHRERRAALAIAGAAAIAVAALSWWPNGQYRPIHRGEQGTLGGLLGQVGQLPSARPSLTAPRARQLGLGGAGGTAATRQREVRRGRSGAVSAGEGGTLGARLRVHNRRRPPGPTGGTLTTSHSSSAGATGTAGSATEGAAPAGTVSSPPPVVSAPGAAGATTTGVSTTSAPPAPAATGSPAAAQGPAPSDSGAGGASTSSTTTTSSSTTAAG